MTVATSGLAVVSLPFVWLVKPGEKRRESGEQCMSLVPPHCTLQPKHIAVHVSQDIFIATAEVIELVSFTSQGGLHASRNMGTQCKEKE